MTKRQHSTKVKAAIAIEAIKGEKTIAEISKHHNVHPSRIHAWKAEVLKGMEGIFNASKSEAEAKIKADTHIETLEKKIGQLVIENDFLKKNYGKLHPGKGLLC
jgi:transposase-like protein